MFTTKLCQDSPNILNDLVECFNQTLASILDCHVPLLTKTLTIRPLVPWFNNYIKKAQRERQKVEKMTESVSKYKTCCCSYFRYEYNFKRKATIKCWHIRCWFHFPYDLSRPLPRNLVNKCTPRECLWQCQTLEQRDVWEWWLFQCYLVKIFTKLAPKGI